MAQYRYIGRHGRWPLCFATAVGAAAVVTWVALGPAHVAQAQGPVAALAPPSVGVGASANSASIKPVHLELPGHAALPADTAGAPRVDPKALAASVTHSDMIMLTVDKTNLRAELRTLPEDPAQSSTLRTFRIAIGKVEGDKEAEGDNRTPEGIYFAQRHIDGERLPGKYGPMAIPIDFPNPMDQIGGRTGHGIWLHGVDHDQRVEEAKVTEGCVAFYNSDIARIGSWLRSHQGVVVIASDVSKLNAPLDLAAVHRETQAWMSAWQERSIDKYAAHYAADFRFEHHDLKSYRDYKARVFKAYKVMDVKFDSLRVIAHPKYAVSFFNQDFQGDNHYSSVGRKILYWEHGADGNWRIKREVFENRRFEHVTFTDAELALLSDPASSISSDKDNKKAPNL